jgi:hypothetical protein
VRIRIRDREADLNVMEVSAGTPPLLGYLPLEALDLYLNPKKRVLEGNPLYNGKTVADPLLAKLRINRRFGNCTSSLHKLRSRRAASRRVGPDL